VSETATERYIIQEINTCWSEVQDAIKVLDKFSELDSTPASDATARMRAQSKAKRGIKCIQWRFLKLDDIRGFEKKFMDCRVRLGVLVQANMR